MKLSKSDVKPSECKTETHTRIEHTKHGVIRHEVRTTRKDAK